LGSEIAQKYLKKSKNIKTQKKHHTVNKNAKYYQNSWKIKGIMTENPYSTLAFLGSTPQF
jgi:hypothetical protein